MTSCPVDMFSDQSYSRWVLLPSGIYIALCCGDHCGKFHLCSFVGSFFFVNSLPRHLLNYFFILNFKNYKIYIEYK